MKPKKRQKMCYNCEGEVDLDVIVCPFCAADLRAEKPEQQKPAFNASASLKNLNTQQSLYPSSQSQKLPVQEEAVMEEENVVESLPEEGEKNIYIPTVLMTLGAQLLVFGLLMLIFSHEGSLILKWDARFWFLYIFASIPFLIFGYKALSK
jgi:hypothetical protein